MKIRFHGAGSGCGQPGETGGNVASPSEICPLLRSTGKERSQHMKIPPGRNVNGYPDLLYPSSGATKTAATLGACMQEAPARGMA
jgi:hypothetical protein